MIQNKVKCQEGNERQIFIQSYRDMWNEYM